jgi:phospholipase C
MAADNPFTHVMVLMLENRSFDHIFGLSGIPGIEGLRGDEFNLLDPSNPASEKFVVRRGGNYSVATGDGPGHSLADTNTQLFGVRDLPTPPPAARNSGFVKAYAHNFFNKVHRQPTSTELQEVMCCFQPEQLPVISTLAKSFVLCDRWHASVPGPTMPNRAYLHAATSQGWAWNHNFQVDMTAKTIYESLEEAGKTWRVYYHDLNEVMQLYQKVKRSPKTMVPFADSFAADVDAGDVANYTVIIPCFLGKHGSPVNSMHAPKDIRPGEKLIADIYGALRMNKAIWESTLFIVVFDEHGGYYDHVAPPSAVNPDGKNSVPTPDPSHPHAEPFPTPFDFARLGLRVPAILISPWLPATVDHDLYEHASVAATLKEVFGLHDFLTKRDRAAGRFSKWFTKAHALRSDTPELKLPIQPHALDDIQREVLRGSIALDPNPQTHDPARIMDITDQEDAHEFVRRVTSRHMEHCMAHDGHPAYQARLAAQHIEDMPLEPASPTLSPARAREQLAMKP